MKYSNKLELVEAIKNNADLFIKEYSDIEESSINIVVDEIGYTPFQMLSFCIGWMDLVLAWENEEQKSIQKTPLATEWKWNNLDWLYQSFYDKYNDYSLKELINTFNQNVDNIIQLVNNLSDVELLETGKRNWAKTNGKEFSVCRLIHLNTIANFKNFRSRKNVSNTLENNISEGSSIIEYKEKNFIQKIFGKIKHLFKRKY